MIKKKLELAKLVELAVEIQRDKDENPEVGAAFGELEESIQEAADELGFKITKDQINTLKETVYEQSRKPRLMQPPAGYNRK